MSKDSYGEMKDRYMPTPVEDSHADMWSKAQVERERLGEDAPLFTPQTFGAEGEQGGLLAFLGKLIFGG